jgi:hypothetical protein
MNSLSKFLAGLTFLLYGLAIALSGMNGHAFRNHADVPRCSGGYLRRLCAIDP